MYNNMNDFKILEKREMKKNTGNNKRKKKTSKNNRKGNIINKKIRGIILVLLGMFLSYLLFNKAGIQNSKISVLKVLLHFMLFIFGKMSFFVSMLLIGIGLFDFFFGDVKLKFHKSKLIALILLFISWSVLYIRQFIKVPLPPVFMEAGRKLLEIGFNKESGGFIGALASMPLYRVMHLRIMDTVIIGIITGCILIIFQEMIKLVYHVLSGLLGYYMSNEYREKMRVLKAKKMAERQEYTESQRQKRDNIRERLIESRKQKLSFEISRKPKDSSIEKPEVYSESELIDKEKEWLRFLEEQEEKRHNRYKNEPGYIQTVTESGEELSEEKLKTEKTAMDERSEGTGDYEDFIEKDNSLEEKAVDKNLPVKNNQKEVLESIEKNASEIEELNIEDAGEYKELLEKSINEIFKSKSMDPAKKKEIEKSIVENVNHLESVLKEFGIEAKVVNYEYGPTITRYEITIPKGVKVNKVTSLSDDIAMNLAAESIRIEAPIPGKNTIGIETPNKIKEPVHFSNIIRNKELEKGGLNIILGKNIVGQDRIIDITKMPHLLIAGQTGSGKSVAVNTLIATLISKKSEKEVRFIMVDPKMVELMPYNGIPHLLVPVIIDPQQAAIALKWTVNEMENRYKQLMENGVRNIVGYNSLSYVEKMPYIVVIIDELADLMMVASGSVEESIARIAQKARAVGIHLIVATQRPSTDVITGMIKANLPSRISFALRSQIDSRTILDSPGAEKLLGQGDMLLLENGSSKLERIQGAFISDDEVMKLTSALKSSKKVQYREEILIDTIQNSKDTDPLFDNAVDVIRQEGKVSISLLQRKLNIGFNRASRIYEQLKENGIINEDNQLLVDDFE